MFCLKCGEAIPDNSEICPKCGANLKEDSSEQAVVYASQKSEPTSKAKKPANKIILIGLSACAVVLILVFAISSIGKANLKKSLIKEWSALSGSIIQVLDIDDTTMQYRLETGLSWLDTTLGTYEWKAISSNQIKVKMSETYRTFTVSFNDDKTVMTISPAITSTDSSETWYYID